MTGLTNLQRRRLLGAAIAGTALSGSLPQLFAAAGAYDLVIRGGRVLDPSQQLDVVADVAIRDGQIALISPDIPDMAESFDARGLLVVPGLIDVHVHARDAELPPSDFLASGVTTLVDAGSRGADNIDSIVEIARNAPNRLRLLQLLRPGDIVTHVYAPTPNGILDANGRLFPAVIAARANGVRFDFGNGLNEHWSWEVAEKALAQGDFEFVDNYRGTRGGGQRLMTRAVFMGGTRFV